MNAALRLGTCLIAALTVISAVVSVLPDDCQPSTGKTSAMAFAGEPVAVVKDLPQYVSNGTPYSLDGSLSQDADGSIVSYSWKVSAAGLSTNLTGISVTYYFVILTTYTIELTVTDNESKTATDTETVESVPDSDSDALPDWWEQKYFGNLVQGPADDFDSDGYLNSEELADGTNPTVEDAQPGIMDKIPVWVYGVIAAAVAAVLVAYFLVLPKLREKQKQEEQKKIQYALEIEKALEEEK